MGWAWFFTWKCAFIFVHFPRPPKNTPGNFCLSSCFNFSVLVIGLSDLRQNVLIGQYQSLNFSIQSVDCLLQNVLSFSFPVKLACLDVATYANLSSRGWKPSQAGILRSL